MAEQTPTVRQLCDAAQAGDLAQVEEILAQNALLARQPITQNGELAIQLAAREGYVFYWSTGLWSSRWRVRPGQPRWLGPSNKATPKSPHFCKAAPDA